MRLDAKQSRLNAERMDETKWEAWAVLHDSHGLILDTLCWCPEWEGPDTDLNWVRIEWLDKPKECNCK